MKKFLLYVAIILLLTAGMAAAADQSLLEIGADYRFRYDILSGRVHDHMYINPQGNPAGSPAYAVWNNSLMLDRVGLNLKANATEDLAVKARLIMYKVYGHQSMQPVQFNYFADRTYGPFDGTIGHVPSDDMLKVDQVYATLSNIGSVPMWISIGRRPSTGGVPTNVRLNYEKQGVEGDIGLVTDYAFDGATAGYAPVITALPGSYAKISYGKGFDSGFTSSANTLKDTDFIGMNIVPYDTNNLSINLQAQKGFHFVDRPGDIAPVPNNSYHDEPYAWIQSIPPSENVGNIAWWGGLVMGKVSDLNLFLAVAQSKTYPTDGQVSGAGLLWDTFHPESKQSLVGSAIYLGVRYDIKSTGTKIGAEYNQGSQYWVGLVPAADDIWTSKLGTRGKVYEIYVIQDLNTEALMKNAKAFWRFGYQYYKFDYTGSNNWMGASVKISDLDVRNTVNVQRLEPVEYAKDLYLVFDVLF
ncbi:MAG: DUF3373 domain-containing protein [Nitrospirae bacterium]|nr:DUF3373 domain-containing protein [Nitrospirota bacterium]